MNKLQAVITAVNDSSLAQGPDQMVYQCWEDGEVTLQKCGELLWQRTLHIDQFACIPSKPEILALDWPHRHNGHAYVFCTEEGTATLRQALREFTP